MAITYTQLSVDPLLNETLAQAIYQREVEHFHYDLNKTNYEQIIATAPDGDYKNSVAQLLADTLVQMNIVESIHAALQTQITDEVGYADAVARAKAARAVI